MTIVNGLAWVLVLASLSFFLYAYLGYPILLWVIGLVTRRRPKRVEEADSWPSVSVTVPAYNEEAEVEDLIESLLALDYPEDRLQIVIVSDATTDRTDEIVRSYSDRGIELLCLEERGGKTRAENATISHLRGEVVVNTDASIRMAPDALKHLVSAFADADVGLASGRDISVSRGERDGNAGESGYVGYEMLVRRLETRVSGIVGASGCLYAVRAPLHRTLVPESLSRDFNAALHAREQGYRSVSVPEAKCFVPRTASLRREYSRKVRTITRGMETLHFKRALLNPFAYGVFSWMLWSHKVTRWMVPLFGVVGLLGVGYLATAHAWARALAALVAIFLGLAWLGWRRSDGRELPRLLSIPAFLVMGNVAAVHAFIRVLRGDRNPIWEPTRRETAKTA